MARVLFLENEVDLVKYLPPVLKDKDLDVVGTTSIDEALEWLRREPFDAVLLDIMMPPTKDMDAERLGYGLETGVEVVRRMRQIKPEVPIVAFTVVTDREIRTKVQEAGVIRFLNKPAEPDQIAEILSQVIQIRK